VFELFRLAIVDGAQRGYTVCSESAVSCNGCEATARLSNRSYSEKASLRNVSYKAPTRTGNEQRRSSRSGQAFFNLVDQPGNIDRLGERSVSLDAQTSLCLRHCD
jgi:hypothetical protein